MSVWEDLKKKLLATGETADSFSQGLLDNLSFGQAEKLLPMVKGAVKNPSSLLSAITGNMQPYKDSVNAEWERYLSEREKNQSESPMAYAQGENMITPEMGAKAGLAGAKGAMFLGMGALKAPKKTMGMAKEFAEKAIGKTPKEIIDLSEELFKKSGGEYHLGLDGMPLWEISDNTATWKAGKGKLSKLLEHAGLYENEPSLKDINTKIKVTPNGGSSTLGNNLLVARSSPDDIMGSLIHEVQHQVQSKSKMARGGSMELFDLPEFKKYITEENIGKYGIEKAKENAYENLLGEIMARASSTRKNLNISERMNRHPFKDYDTLENPIIRY